MPQSPRIYKPGKGMMHKTDYTDIHITTPSRNHVRVIIDTEFDSDPWEVRIYMGNDDEPWKRIPIT